MEQAVVDEAREYMGGLTVKTAGESHEAVIIGYLITQPYLDGILP